MILKAGQSYMTKCGRTVEIARTHMPGRELGFPPCYGRVESGIPGRILFYGYSWDGKVAGCPEMDVVDD